jgi:hypothetical protein
MNLGTVEKQPVERQSYTINYEQALTDGDNVISATTSVAPSGLTVESPSVYDPRVKFWVSGGLSGITYKVQVTTTTEDGRVFQDELYFKVREI